MAYSGIRTIRPAGEAVQRWKAGRLHGGMLWIADAANYAHGVQIHGIFTHDANPGANAYCRTLGVIASQTFAWTPGKLIYAGTGGELTQTPPTNGVLKPLAIAETATRIFVDRFPIEGYAKTFSAVTEVTITHNLGRFVNAKVIVGGEWGIPDERQTKNELRLLFDLPTSGEVFFQ